LCVYKKIYIYAQRSICIKITTALLTWKRFFVFVFFRALPIAEDYHISLRNQAIIESLDQERTGRFQLLAEEKKQDCA